MKEPRINNRNSISKLKGEGESDFQFSDFFIEFCDCLTQPVLN